MNFTQFNLLVHCVWLIVLNISLKMPSTIIKMPNSSSVQRRQQQTKNKNGIKIGCFRVCTCIHLDFLTSKSGMLKLFELLLGSCCETLLINFGMQASAEIGKAFHGFLTTVTACLTTTFVLCLCYVLSSRSYNLIRQSLFVRIIINQN